jgi:hypothetical protein
MMIQQFKCWNQQNNLKPDSAKLHRFGWMTERIDKIYGRCYCRWNPLAQLLISDSLETTTLYTKWHSKPLDGKFAVLK